MALFEGWSFYEFVEPSGQVPFGEWMSTVPEAQDFIDARLLIMRGLAKWPEKWASKYWGTQKIIEIRVTFSRVQYRPLGIYAPGYRFVLLGGAKEKGRIPRQAIDAVVRRQELLDQEPNHVRRYRFNQK